MNMKVNFKNGSLPIRKNTAVLERFEHEKYKRGLKTSKKRSYIVHYFLSADRHYSVEELYNELRTKKPHIGYSTVYRTLRLLAEFGLASERNFRDGVSRFEPVHKAQHHDHLICTECGKIIEFTNQHIERLQQTVARRYRFATIFHKLELYGLCEACRRKKRKCS
jgi:Fur family ferric uptake transcriptional regulator